jgi:hypothetical protein
MEKALGMFVVLLFALAMTGVAESHWTDNVKIQATVHMGDFVVGWLDIKGTWDNEPGLPVPKDVGKISASLADPKTSVHTGKTIYHTLNVLIDNGYPQYEAWCEADLKNAGTIPAHIVEVNIVPMAGLVIGDEWYDYDGFPLGWELDNAITGKPVLNVELYKFEEVTPPALALLPHSVVCNQIDPCHDIPVYLHIDIKQAGAEECHTYNFSINILAVQWNKAWEYLPTKE